MSQYLKEFDRNDLPNYWLTPPDLYKKLNDEFNFDFDPCPYPKKFDGLNCNWGKMNYVNPPFKNEDGGTMDFIRKAINEQQKGNSSVIVFSTRSAVNTLLEVGAEVRSLGRVRWLEVNRKTPSKSPPAITLFYLKGVK